MNAKEKNALFRKGLYVSYNSRVNDPESENGINEAGLAEVLEEMEQEGWTEVEPEAVEKNQRIRYIRHEKNEKLKFVAGGFVQKNDYIGKSISYLSGKIWGVYYSDIYVMWTIEGRPRGRPKKEKEEYVVRYKAVPEGDFKHTVKIGDTVVYKTDSLGKKKKFESTMKFEIANRTKNFIVEG